MTVEEARAKLKDLKEKEKSGGIPYTELEDGENLIRIVADQDGNFYVETAYHYLKRGKDTIVMTCNEVHDGSECWSCGKRMELFKTKNKDDKEAAKELRPNPRIFFNIVNRKNKKEEVLGCGNSVFKAILKYWANEEWGDLTDIKKGYDIIIDKTKTGPSKMDVEYDTYPKKNSSPLGVDYESLKMYDIASIPEMTLYNAMEQEMLYDGATVEEINKLRKEMNGEEEVEEVEEKEVRKPKKEEKEEKNVKRKAPVEDKEEEEPSLEEKYAHLIKKLPLDIPKVNKKYQAWLEDDGTKAKLVELIEMYGSDDENEPEKEDESEKEEKSEGESKLQSQMDAAIRKFKEKAANKKGK